MDLVVGRVSDDGNVFFDGYAHWKPYYPDQLIHRRDRNDRLFEAGHPLAAGVKIIFAGGGADALDEF